MKKKSVFNFYWTNSLPFWSKVHVRLNSPLEKTDAPLLAMRSLSSYGKSPCYLIFLSVSIFLVVALSSFKGYSQENSLNHLTSDLIVTLPWWKTWWAFLIYLFLTIAYLVRRYELNRIKLRTQLRLEKIETDSLRSLDRIKSQFFANISHEFRTPLTLILGQLENIMAKGIHTDDMEELKVIENNSRKLLMLINQILDLSKLDAGRMELSASQQNIVPFMKGLLYSFESLAGLKRVSLLFESVQDDIQVVFDPDKMEKIINNLVSNAVKFADESGWIKVSIKIPEQNFVEIWVENNGIGIPAEQLPHIFDRFYQVEGPGMQNFEGSGLGLALAKELVDLHKGSISVQSMETVNAVFIVRLPAGDVQPVEGSGILPVDKQFPPHLDSGAESVTPETHEYMPDDPSDDNREIILIVEDNKDVRDFILCQLKDDYLVREAENGRKGILIAQELVPDLIISDLMMPVMDGYQFCEEIRKDARTSHIPVIMLTARADQENKIKGLETGVDDYITKPFSTKELKARVRNLIHQRKLNGERLKKVLVIKPTELNVKSIDKVFLEKVITYIEANFENPNYTIETLASQVQMGPSQLNRKLNALIGQPAGQLIRSMRLQRASELLGKNAGTVSQISYQLGFSDQAYFSRAFRKQFGCSPGEYKNARKVQDFA